MPSPRTLSPRRRQLLESALEVVGENGLRGLTHRAVDRQAGLPEGSCSAYLRTRSALHGALASFVASRLGDDVRRLAEDLASCADLESTQDAILGLFQNWLATPSLLVAKLELTMEATRDPALAEIFAESRRELVAVVDTALEQHTLTSESQPAPDRAEALVAALDGVLLGALQLPREDQAAYLTSCLGELMGPLIGSDLEATH